MSDTIIAVWLWGIIPASAIGAWQNRYVSAPDSSLYMVTIWPVVMIYAAFHVAFSGPFNTDKSHD